MAKVIMFYYLNVRQIIFCIFFNGIQVNMNTLKCFLLFGLVLANGTDATKGKGRGTCHLNMS
jgi:hypothetical protein